MTHPKSREEKMKNKEYFRFRHGGFAPGSYDKDRYGYDGYESDSEAQSLDKKSSSKEKKDSKSS